MIPLSKKELFIQLLKERKTMKEAMEIAQIPKTSLYRLFREQPGFEQDAERAIEEGKQIEIDQGLEKIRQIIKNRGK